MGVVDRIRKLCEEKGITINKLEKEADVGRGNVARWDKHRPNIDKVQRVADYFGVSADYILTENENKPTATGELDKDTMELLNLAHSLGEDDRALLLSMARELKKRRG